MFSTASTSNIVTIYDGSTTFNNVIQANSGINIANNYAISNGLGILRMSGRYLMFNDGITSTSSTYDARVITSRTYRRNLSDYDTYNYIPVVL